MARLILRWLIYAAWPTELGSTFLFTLFVVGPQTRNDPEMAAWTYDAQVHQPAHFTTPRDFPLLILHVRRPDHGFGYGGQRITVWIFWAKSFEKKRSESNRVRPATSCLRRVVLA